MGDNQPMEIPSPCIDICTLDDREVCVGCGRHINEIAAWGGAAPDVKLLIVAAAPPQAAISSMWRPQPTQTSRSSRVQMSMQGDGISIG